MIKKTFLLMPIIFFILTDCLLLANDIKHCTCNTPELTITEKVIMGALLGGAIVAAAPYVLAAGSTIKIVVVLKSAIAAGIPTSAAGKICLGLTVAQMVRPHVLQTTEEQLSKLLEEKDSMPARSKAEFVSCLKENKTNSPRNIFGRPAVCEGVALLYAFNSSVSELNERTEAFKRGICFCK